jgi:hypothetical protein
MAFQISSLSRDRFEELFTFDDATLAARGITRHVADKKPGFPCRVSLNDAEPGERVLLLSFQHQSAASPYRASGPIFVRELAEDAAIPPNAVPQLLRTRVLSVRGYDANGMMTEADVVDGRDVETLIVRLLHDQRAEYLHVHLARPGCYVCRVDRT